MDPFSVEAYTTAEIAHRLEKVSQTKCTLDPLRVFRVLLLSGAFIALGAALFISD